MDDSGQTAPTRVEEDRRAKLERLRAEGVDPFPHAFPGADAIERVRAAHHDLEAGAETDARYRVAGRLAARRDLGKLAFLDLVDRSGRIQLQAKRDALGEESFDRLVSLDLGDLIGVDGDRLRARGAASSRCGSSDWTLLAKSLLPPPEKFHGLEDVETRLRRRELDLIANEEARELFILRSRVISAIRRWFDARGFIEVETPVLQPLYGGALARPFTTHHNALGRDLYLRIATELYLKRLIVGGLERVYELGKDFRNEGISHKHNPEFTMLEWYEAYADYQDEAERLEQPRRRRRAGDRLRGTARPLDRRGGGSRSGRDRRAHRHRRARAPASVRRSSRPRASAASSSTRPRPGPSSSTSCSRSMSSPSSRTPRS